MIDAQSATLSADKRKKVLDRVLAVLQKRFYEPEKLNSDWHSAVQRHRPLIESASTPIEFEKEVSDLLRELQPAQQEQALTNCFREEWNGAGAKAKRILLPVRHLQQWIEHNVLLLLRQAPFNKRDAQLVPAAGSCVECPKRTGHNKLLFADVSGNRSIKAKKGESGAELLKAFVRKADEGTIGKLVIEAVILLSARNQADGGKTLRAAAQAYGVDTDAVALKVKQEFAAKEKARKTIAPGSKPRVKAKRAA